MSVVSQLYSDVVSHVPIFKHLEEETILEICAALLPILYSAGDNVIREGDKSNAMYFIMEGVSTSHCCKRCTYSNAMYLHSPTSPPEMPGHGRWDYFGAAGGRQLLRGDCAAFAGLRG